MAIESIPEFYTDEIDEQGGTKRIRFFCRLVRDTGEHEWHYFGVDPLVRPPPPPFDAFPVFEHGLIRFPQGLDDLTGPEADEVLMGMAKISGFRRAGLTAPND